MKITRGQLQEVIGEKTKTKTVHYAFVQRDLEIDDTWTVRYLNVDEKGVLEIYCEKQ